MFKAKLDFFLNEQLDPLIKEKLSIGDNLESFQDAEDQRQILHSSSLNFAADDEFKLIDTLKEHIENLEDEYRDIHDDIQIVSDPLAFSRVMITLYNIEIENKKINFTPDPHKAHIHQFNRCENGMVRIKELQFMDLLHRTKHLLDDISYEI